MKEVFGNSPLLDIDVVIPFHFINSDLLFSIQSIKQSIGVQPRIIAVNDTGLDASPAEIGIDEKDLLVRCQGKGYVDAMATGVGLARANFIAFQDSDDFSDPHRLSIQLGLLIDNDLDLVAGRLIRTDPLGIPKMALSPFGSIPNSLTQSEKLIFGPHGADSSLVGRVEIFRRYWGAHSSFSPSFADYGWLLYVLPKISSGYANDALYFYRSHDSQMSRNAKDMDQWDRVSRIWVENLLQVSEKRQISGIDLQDLDENPRVCLSIAFPSALPRLSRQEKSLLYRSIALILLMFTDESQMIRKQIQECLYRRGFVASRGCNCRYWSAGFRMLLDLITRYSQGLRPRFVN